MSNHYTFLKSRTNEIVPAFVLPSGNLPLHSTVDPKREAQRLVATIPEDTGFVIFLGLGGGFAVEAALALTAAQIVVIDFNRDAVNELLSSKDYSTLLNNKRAALLIDPSENEIKNFILEQYKPALCGGIKIIPLRTRTERDLEIFDKAAAAIQEAIESVSADYSVQAHFGTRWFSNIIRNIKNIETMPNCVSHNKLPSHVKEAAVIAAGPSLNRQMPSLKKHKANGTFIICSDTALPALIHNGIKPDAVVSIDCQHISYYHFTGCKMNKETPLILDIASPPMLSRLSPSPVFFCSGHPLAQYFSANFLPLMQLDTSGGNVTYACLSLAENLGAQRITLFGADFSYVRSSSYARGTYIYPFFEKAQNRFTTLEALFSAFLYRAPFLPPESQRQNYHETASLRFYRKKLEEKAAVMSAEIFAEAGDGAPINFYKMPQKEKMETPAAEKRNINALDFLKQYRDDIAALPAANDDSNYMAELDTKNRQIFTTLLPYAAALKHRNKNLKTAVLIEEVKRRCIKEIDELI